ncbi:MAG: hypothetical protein LDLANPLL_01501 [Turneriella sp.]|nr:hypothetical protein [Turneriella sp.]
MLNIRINRNLIQALGIAIGSAALYFLLNHLTGNRPGMYWGTFFDHSIPFTPWAIFGYALGYVFVFVPFFLLADELLLKKIFLGFILCTILALLIFLVFPSRLPRHGIPTQENFFYWSIALIYVTDRPVAAIPSLLALHAFFASWCVFAFYRKIGIALFVASFLFAVSAVALREQVVLSIALSFAIATLIFFYLIRPLIKNKNTAKIHETNALIFALWKKIAILYGGIILVGFILFFVGVRFLPVLPEN